jgi:hypothetical protein
MLCSAISSSRRRRSSSGSLTEGWPANEKKQNEKEGYGKKKKVMVA